MLKDLCVYTMCDDDMYKPGSDCDGQWHRMDDSELSEEIQSVLPSLSVGNPEQH